MKGFKLVALPSGHVIAIKVKERDIVMQACGGGVRIVRKEIR